MALAAKYSSTPTKNLTHQNTFSKKESEVLRASAMPQPGLLRDLITILSTEISGANASHININKET